MYFNKYLQKEFYNKINELNCCMFAKVTKINKLKSTVDVLPLHKHFVNDNLLEFPILVNVPLLQNMSSNFIIKIPINVNDIVLLLFVDYDIQNLVLTGELKDTNTKEIHSLNNAVALPFNFNIFNHDLDINDNNYLVIGKKDNSVKIKIDNTNNVIIDTTGNILLGESATEGIPLGTSLKNWLDNHTHPVAGIGNTGTPNTGSPSPSSKSKVE